MNRKPIISRLTLRLPKILHQQLATLAKNEGLSVNQYIVDALTRQAALVSMIQNVPETELLQQQQALQSFIKELFQTSSSEIDSILATGQQPDAEVNLSADVVAHLQDPLKKQ